jgi:phosphate transport system substrate-binding protein
VKRAFLSGVLAIAVVFALVMTGCVRGGSGGSGTAGGGSAGDSAGSGSIRVAGSDTMVNMAQAWAEGYMATDPNVQITVKGGGSGTGITALIEGAVDFADASREMKPEEKDKLKAKGGTAVETKVARDGIAVIVNPANKVTGLTLDQLGRIYRGEITNWKQVGGADRPIVLLSRDPSSGTFEFFKEKVVGTDKNYARAAQMLPSNQAIAGQVKTNDAAIGYIGVGYESSGTKVLAVDGVQSSVKTVLDGSYVLSRYLYMYSNGEPTGVRKAYLDWILGPEGQKVVTDQGFVPLGK